MFHKNGKIGRIDDANRRIFVAFHWKTHQKEIHIYVSTYNSAMAFELAVVMRNWAGTKEQQVTNHHVFVVNRLSNTQAAGWYMLGRYYSAPNADGCSWGQRQFATEL
jgi:hypothetical protein